MSSLAPQRPDGFFDDWEIASAQTRIDLIRSRLDSHIAYCRTAVPFFHERLDGFDPTAGAALQNVPQMGANDLRTHLPPAGDALLGPDRLAITMFQSGGTTGMPKSAPFSHQELEALTFANARGFHAVGLKTEDRVANMFAVGSLYMTFVHINRMLQEFGCTNFPFASNTPPDFVDTVVDVFNINCFTGIASIVLDCLRAIGDKRELRVEKVFYGGEHIYDADVEELMTRFGVRTVAAPGYGTVESWYIGYQCAECPRGVFHAHDDQTYIEIVDEEG
ncbi:MAG: AMP-binding protein, partial [Myxococcota bacterium]